MCVCVSLWRIFSSVFELYFCHVVLSFQPYFFIIVIKRDVWLYIKQCSTEQFFNMSCTKLGIKQLLSNSSPYVYWRLVLFQLSVPVVPLFTSYSWCVSIGLSLQLRFVSVNRFVTFEHRITSWAFIYQLSWFFPDTAGLNRSTQFLFYMTKDVKKIAHKKLFQYKYLLLK